MKQLPCITFSRNSTHYHFPNFGIPYNIQSRNPCIQKIRLYKSHKVLTCTISIMCNAQCASTIEPCSCFEIAKLDIPRPAFHVSTDGDSFVPQFTLLLQFCPYFYLNYSEYKYEFYQSYFSAASRALTKAQAKGLATPFLSQNTGG